jgi:hypothetical protein
MSYRMFLVAVLVSSACAAPRTVSTPSISPDATPARSAATANASSAPLTLHWMSFSAHSEPRYRLLYEGGKEASFTQLRLIGPDGRIVAAAASVASADDSLGMCARAPRTYGPIRTTLILASQDVLHDVIQRPDAYPVEVLVNGSWLRVGLVNECHAQE